MPFAAATATAAAPPSTSPKATADVQTTLHSLRQVPGTRDALPAGRPGLGRSYRRRSRPGQELAPHGLRIAADRKSVVYGKSVQVRVNPGWRRILKKKKQDSKSNNYSSICR